MIIFGICGSSGSGKSTVAAVFQKRGALILDCDEIYHELISSDTPCLKAIGNAFGKEYIQNDSLDRKKLGALVFRDDEKRKKLNEITHQFVKEELKKRLDRARDDKVKACLIDAPLFFEARLEDWCDAVIGVTAPKKEKILRICKRDGISKKEAELRLSSQIPDCELRSRCDFWIENRGDLSDLEAACREILEKYRL